MGLLDRRHAFALIADVDALARCIIVPRQHLALPQCTHHGGEGFGTCDQRDVRVTVSYQFGGVVDEHLRRVAARGSVAIFRRIGTEHIAERLGGVVIATERQAARVRAVGDEADDGDVIDERPELVAEAGILGGEARGIFEEMHRRAGLLDVFFFLHKLADTNEDGCAIFRCDGHDCISLAQFFVLAGE